MTDVIGNGEKPLFLQLINPYPEDGKIQRIYSAGFPQFADQLLDRIHSGNFFFESFKKVFAEFVRENGINIEIVLWCINVERIAPVKCGPVDIAQRKFFILMKCQFAVGVGHKQNVCIPVLDIKWLYRYFAKCMIGTLTLLK